MKTLIPLACLAFQFNPAIAQSAPTPPTKVSMETCLQAARAKLESNIVTSGFVEGDTQEIDQIGRE